MASSISAASTALSRAACIISMPSSIIASSLLSSASSIMPMASITADSNIMVDALGMDSMTVSSNSAIPAIACSMSSRSIVSGTVAVKA